MDHPMSAYMGVFLDELDEQLQMLDAGLLRLEQDPADMNTISVIFRAAHTLKGSAAAMGFEPLKDLTHSLENVFELIRNRELAISASIIDALFHSIDYMKVLRQAIHDGTLEETNIRPLTDTLGRIYKQAKNGAGESGNDEEAPREEKSAQSGFPLVRLDEFQRNTVLEAINDGFQVMAVSIRLNSDAVMKSVRALLVYNNLNELGEVVVSYPATEEIEDEQSFQGGLVFLFVTKESRQSVIDTINQTSQIDAFHIDSIHPHNVDSYCEGRTVPVIQTEAAHPPAGEELASELPKPRAETEPKPKVSQTVRVDVDRLEKLLNYVGELIIDNTRLQQFQSRFNANFRDHEDAAVLNDICSHFGRVISDLQDGMMKTRMLPIEQLFNRFPRLVRDAAQIAGKEIDFVMEGKETELDRTLIEEISDPIIHLLRNAADHGIESPDQRESVGKTRRGKLVLKAAHQENQIVISIADDGRGIDPQKVKQSSIRKGFITAEEAERMTDKELVFLIFQSGVSTADKITDLSGRGVGMDIVRSHIEKLSGIIDIDTSVGEGTVITIRLPLTLAIIRSLLVRLGPSTFAIPLVNVIEIVRLRHDEIRTIQGREVCVIRGTVFPLIRMHRKMNMPQTEAEREGKRLFVVVVGIADKRVCLVVDRTVGNQEIVIKSLGRFVGDVPYISGSTILGDGHVALILDVGAIVKEEGSLYASHEAEPVEHKAKHTEQQLVTFTLEEEQYGLSIHKVKEIIKVPPVTKMIDAPPHMLGLVNLRGALLPAFDLRRCFGLPPKAHSEDSRIVVVETNSRDVGILIDKVTEVLKVSGGEIETAPARTGGGDSRAIHGIYKKGDRFVMLLDIDRILDER
ncbi:chemotaxis protein CheW [Paenibacillus ginsengarvi]|uniref:Chemotaxis protein CheA n=1 Tax=Paenibacillus ginsengarvi TaxID=400777 RepID=A0A3B0CE00_9BACL|nr:chemotaxis protein CheW [Paenibacillus ginsengarvi]RKN82017.1 chemotaxis protein CheA [Paenibacillus ginsengarvi]